MNINNRFPNRIDPSTSKTFRLLLLTTTIVLLPPLEILRQNAVTLQPGKY